MLHYNQRHFSQLLKAYDNDFNYLSSSFGSQKDPNTFRKHLLSLDEELRIDQEISNSLQKKFDHKPKGISIDDLKKYCRSSEETVRKLICIMAWGGMKEHQFMMCMTGSALSKCKTEKRYKSNKEASKIHKYHDLKRICETMDHIYNTKLDQSNVYEAFSNLKLFQCGPAYFTKLMFFMSYEINSCYIMDQWTARSINLLVDKELIKMRKSQNPSPAKENDSEVYKSFCYAIEDLSEKISHKKGLKISPHQLEQLIFSRGGKGNKLQWRKYVEDFG